VEAYHDELIQLSLKPGKSSNVNVQRDRSLFTVPSQVDLFNHVSLSTKRRCVVYADNGDKSQGELGRLYITVHLHVGQVLISFRFRARSGVGS